ELFEGFYHGDDNAASGGFGAALTAPDNDGLAGDDSGDGVADGHAVGIHNPGHDALVRAHVRRRDVGMRADKRDKFGSVAPGQTFEFGLAEFLWVDDDAPLGPAERNVNQSAFPRHPHGECAHFIQCDCGAVANTAFRWPQYRVVMHTVAGKHLEFAVVAAHRKVHGEFAARVAQKFDYVVVNIE